jgi:hypothetical protein
MGEKKERKIGEKYLLFHPAYAQYEMFINSCAHLKKSNFRQIPCAEQATRTTQPDRLFSSLNLMNPVHKFTVQLCRCTHFRKRTLLYARHYSTKKDRTPAIEDVNTAVISCVTLSSIFLFSFIY